MLLESDAKHTNSSGAGGVESGGGRSFYRRKFITIRRGFGAREVTGAKNDGHDFGHDFARMVTILVTLGGAHLYRESARKYTLYARRKPYFNPIKPGRSPVAGHLNGV